MFFVLILNYHYLQIQYLSVSAEWKLHGRGKNKQKGEKSCKDFPSVFITGESELTKMYTTLKALSEP